MSNYPAKLAVLAPTFITAHDENAATPERKHTYLIAYSLLSVTRTDDGFQFAEEHPITEKLGESLDLLIRLGKALDVEASLAGKRLDQIVSLLIRTPVGEVREADGIAPLNRLREMLRNPVIDAERYADRAPARTAEGLAKQFGLDALNVDTGERNPAIVARMLSARTQSIWLAIAHEFLPADELSQAIADYNSWRAVYPIA